ncbi:MAG: aspartate/glutamate racemase family protein, partial [Veillonellaceae bacterium]|nr:aspartate/glutamate racemase family protein [Veillonellaceae bacterium]
MPSRTRALLTGEGQTEIVETIANSMKKMLDYDVDCMVMICGTAHYFLPYVHEKLPEAKDKVVNILEATGKHLAANNIDKVLILAAEGTLKQKLYSRTLARYNIACIEPEEQYWEEIRYFIECVKQNKYDSELKDRFLRFLGRYDVDNIILGCTEFPVLLKHIDMDKEIYNFYDPLTYAINEIHSRIS